MTSSILLTGGTGRLGRHVTPLLVDAGAKLRVLSRTSRESGNGVQYVTGDLLNGQGIDRAVDGAEVILHLAGGPKGDGVATRNLVEAAMRAGGVGHVVYVSVIAADRVPLGWFRSKLEAEQAVSRSGLPFTTLRAAQFHDAVFDLVQKMAKLPVVPSPGGLRLQPVDTREVADRLVELALDGPAGLVPDLAGPKAYAMRDLVQSYLRASGKRRLLLPIRIPGVAGRAYRAGDNLNLDTAVRGKRTWEDFLAERAGRAPDRATPEAQR